MNWRSVPGSRRLAVHASSGRSGRHLRALTGTSDWRRSVVDRAGIAALVAVGAQHLRPATPPAWPPHGLPALADTLKDELPGLRLIGFAAPRQPGRRRMSLLGRMAGNLVVVKLGGDDVGLERETAALELLAADPLPGIDTPLPLAGGTLPHDEPIAYLVTGTVALRHQRPAIDEPLRTFESDLAERLSALPLDADAGPDPVPVHGDLTPWNLRRTRRGLALFDWESAGWGPSGSDLATYRRASDEVRRPWNSRPDPAADPIGAGR